MAMEVVTKEDLQQLRVQLISDIQNLVMSQQTKGSKRWLKNAEIKMLLNISSNTVQRLRVAGKLRSTKLGGIHYYRYEDIEKLLNSDAD